MSQHEIFFVIGSYLLGSVPVGYILYYLHNRKDIREEGSGNIGAANMLRTQGKTAALTTLLLDMVKGVLPLLYGAKHFDSSMILALGGAAVVLGHLFPLYLKFKGGKGIASLVGVLLVFHFPSALAFGGIFFAALYFTRYVSVASVAAAAGAFFVVTFTQIAEVSTILLGITILITMKHSTNFRRISAGTENKFAW